MDAHIFTKDDPWHFNRHESLKKLQEAFGTPRLVLTNPQVYAIHAQDKATKTFSQITHLCRYKYAGLKNVGCAIGVMVPKGHYLKEKSIESLSNLSGRAGDSSVVFETRKDSELAMLLQDLHDDTVRDIAYLLTTSYSWSEASRQKAHKRWVAFVEASLKEVDFYAFLEECKAACAKWSAIHA